MKPYIPSTTIVDYSSPLKGFLSGMAMIGSFTPAKKPKPMDRQTANQRIWKILGLNLYKSIKSYAQKHPLHQTEDSK